MTSDLCLYELVLDNGCSVSPFVWRTKYALAHKGLAAKSAPVGFGDIPKVLGGTFKTVPILETPKGTIGDSWDIAERLDADFPQGPNLFGSPAERAMARFFDAWFSGEVMRRMFGIYVLDIHNAARPEDRPYFRQSREARLGQPLEAVVAKRESLLPALREALSPLRTTLSRSPFIGGKEPNYADYIALGGFLWIAAVNTLPPLAADDPLLAWLNRGLDLFGGLGRDPRLKRLAA
jgi:glutathione S-transferase